MSAAGVVKKRQGRRPSKPGDEASAPSTSVTEPAPKKTRLITATSPPTITQVAEKSVYNEEEELEALDSAEDQRMFSSSCRELQQLMKDIYELKTKGKKDSPEAMEKRMQVSLNFGTLKKLNRLAHMRCKKSRDSTHQVKQKADGYHLQLQNLLYEVMHLQKEITRCLEFKSKDEDIELVPEKDFYAKAPTEISKPTVTKNDHHRKKLAQLDWELEQRKRLAEKYKAAELSKEEVSQEILKRKESLDNLQPQLNKILGTTKPLQKCLAMPFDETRAQHQAAQNLPRPLYVLYIQSVAYHEALDPGLTVTIGGDLEVVGVEENYLDAIDNDSDSDDEVVTTSRRRRTHGDQLAEKRKKALKKHPLSILLSIKCKDGSLLDLTFCYMTFLNIVTVEVKLKPAEGASSISSITGSELLSSDKLLSNLFPGDTGLDTPNLSNHYQLDRLGMDLFGSYVGEIGFPFKWAQQLSGLDFLEPAPDQPAGGEPGPGGQRVQSVSEVSKAHMESTVQALRARVHARLALQSQLASLERHLVPVASQCKELFPAKVLSRLTSWTSIPYEDYVSLEHTAEKVHQGLVRESDLFYWAWLERGSAKCKVAVALSQDYPVTPPLFSLEMNWRKVMTATNSDAIREMESEVNIHYQDLVVDRRSRDQLLANQLQRLLMCMDVFLETEPPASVQGPAEFVPERVYLKMARGRTRSKPFLYSPEKGTFTQR